jgi:glycosyltransferase involved in cell wall biosynthesis
MRIAVLAPPWLPVPPPAYGGTEAVIDGLCRGLRSAGQEVLLIAPSDSTCPVPRRGLTPAAGTEAMHPGIEARAVLDGYRAAHDWGADVVHDHTVIGPLLADRWPTTTVITTNHGPFVEPLTGLYHALAGRVPIIAISHHQARSAAGIAIEAVIHHGLDVASVPVGTGSGWYAAFLGRMAPEKGAERAIRLARAAGVPLKLAAKMREPAEHRYFREHVEPHLGPDVEFLGEVGGQEKLRFLGDAICLLNPIAWAEPFGMVMIEALACGTPVVTSPLGAAPEIVADGVTGRLGVEDATLVDAVRAAAAGRFDRAACRRDAEQRFSLERMAADHLACYRRVVERALATVA